MNELVIVMTNGIIKNNHSYLTSYLSFFPIPIIGVNKERGSTASLKICTEAGDEIVTEIDGEMSIVISREWIFKIYNELKERVVHADRIAKVS